MTASRTIIVTGASSGIGLATARRLAAAGVAVIMISRDPARGTAARELVAQDSTGPEPLFLPADLSSQQQIRAVAGMIHERYRRIDALLNNAGTAAAHREITVDGLEKTFATNHLGPFLLTDLLLDLLIAAPAGRIITTTSESHSRHLDFANLQGERRYGFFSAYSRSKLANILFTYELARRLRGTEVTANCFTPGPTASSFGRGAGGLMGLMSGLVRLIGRSAEDAARTAVFLATAPEMRGISGRYFSHGRPSRSKRVSYDPVVAARLWAISEQLTQIPSPVIESTRQPSLEGIK